MLGMPYCFNYLFSEQGLGEAAHGTLDMCCLLPGLICMFVSQCLTSSALSLGRTALCAHSLTVLVLYLVWIGQPCAHAQQCPTHSAQGSPESGYLHVLLAPTFFGQGSPTYTCSSALLSPHFLWTGHFCVQYHSTLLAPHSLLELQPQISTQQCPAISALSLDRVALWADIAAFFQLHTLSRQGNPAYTHNPVSTQSGTLPISTGSIAGWRSPSHACYGTLLFLLNLAPGEVAVYMLQWSYSLVRELGWSSHLLPKCKGDANSGAHLCLWYWIVPSATRELSQFTTSSLSLSCTCCAEAV